MVSFGYSVGYRKRVKVKLLFDEIDADRSGLLDLDEVLQLTKSLGMEELSAQGPPTPLSHRCFSAVSPPNFAHFTPFFARSLRLGARKPDSAK